MDVRSNHEVLVPCAELCTWETHNIVMSLLCWCFCKLAITRLGDYYTSLSRTMQSIFAEPVRMLSATYNQNALPTMSATTSDTSSSANDLAIHFEIKSCGAPLNKPSPIFCVPGMGLFFVPRIVLLAQSAPRGSDWQEGIVRSSWRSCAFVEAVGFHQLWDPTKLWE